MQNLHQVPRNQNNSLSARVARDHHSAQLQICMRPFANQSEILWRRKLLACMIAKASVLREDWATAEQIERVQLQLLDVVDFINRFHASAKTRLAVLNEKMTAIERKLSAQGESHERNRVVQLLCDKAEIYEALNAICCFLKLTAVGAAWPRWHPKRSIPCP
ncbi:hypothetical protein GQ600_2186 [Phytophthora cactorum]|nr:hypothetical protein GQ600_2186 [Phytophthora cactorum]